MEAGYGSDRGRVRSSNEDSVWVGERLLIVADGMGGAAAGEVASRLAVETVRSWRYPSMPAPVQTIKDELERSVHAANQEIYDRARRQEDLRGMGTTLTVALVIKDSEAVVAHVGDSRAYLVKAQGLERITQDHSVVGELIRSGGLAPSQAESHPYRNVLTRALGTSRRVDVDMARVHIEPGEGLLLCTDGLTAVLSDQEMLEAIRQAHDAQAAVEALIILANERGGPDNVSAIVAYPGGGQACPS